MQIWSKDSYEQIELNWKLNVDFTWKTALLEGSSAQICVSADDDDFVALKKQHNWAKKLPLRWKLDQTFRYLRRDWVSSFKGSN